MNLTNAMSRLKPGAGGPQGKRPAVPDLWKVYGGAMVVCGALSAGTYLLGVQPALAKRETDQSNTDELQARRQKATDLVSVLTATRQKLDRALLDVESLPLRLEPASTINQRLAKLTDLASAAGLVINEMQPGAAVDSAHFQAVPVRVSGSGTYPACTRFFKRLREKFPDTAVRSFEAANPNPNREGNAATFKFELTWYTAPIKKG